MALHDPQSRAQVVRDTLRPLLVRPPAARQGPRHMAADRPSSMQY